MGIYRGRGWRDYRRGEVFLIHRGMQLLFFKIACVFLHTHEKSPWKFTCAYETAANPEQPRSIQSDGPKTRR